ncbi:MAG: SRPBCC domain-containing protein [Bacillota bacterium]|nr:SRPBCC domain-containing protein [Bacillota bacterium]
MEQVWAAAGTQEGLRRWFNKTISFAPGLGGRWEMSGEHWAVAYTFGGQTTEWDPPRRIVMTWDWVPPRWPAPSLSSIELEAQDGTQVTRNITAGSA